MAVSKSIDILKGHLNSQCVNGAQTIRMLRIHWK